MGRWVDERWDCPSFGVDTFLLNGFLSAHRQVAYEYELSRELLIPFRGIPVLNSGVATSRQLLLPRTLL